MTANQTARSAGARFRRALAEEKPLQIAGTINAYHARLATASGFRAIYVSGGGVAAGSLGIPEGVLYGYPVTCKGGKIEIVKGIEVSDFSRKRMDATLKELHEERDGVKHLLGK